MLEKITEINPDAIILSGFDSEIIGIASLVDRQVTITNPLTNEIVFKYEIDYDENDMNHLVDNDEETVIEGLWSRTAFTNLVAYDTNKIQEKLSADMSEEEASEYFYFNIEGAYLGEQSPIFKTNLI